MRAANVDLKAVVFGQVPVAAQVPFADVPRLIATLVESAGQRVLLRRQLLEIRHIDELTTRWVGAPMHVDPVGDADGGWVLAGEDAGAGRRTDRAGRVRVGKAHALAGEAVDVGRFVEGTAVADEILPAHIVDEDEDDVGPRHARASSMAATTAGSLGVVRGAKRASGWPSLSMRNFSKFQEMSPGKAAPSPAR